MRKVPGLKKKPSTSELIDWLKLLMADDIPDEILTNRDASKAIPPLYGALVKNEQDVHLLERLAFMNRRDSRVGENVLINFFFTLRKYKVPVTIRELLDLLLGLKSQLVYANLDDFYLLSRTALVKDEKNYDKFDRAFSAYFKGLDDLHGLLESLILFTNGCAMSSKSRCLLRI